MGVTCNIDTYRMAQFAEKAEKELAQQVKLQLNYLGQECVAKTRKRSSAESWIDRTGNLRSSIGAAVIESGKASVCQGLKAEAVTDPDTKKKSTGKNGVTQGEKAILEYAGGSRDTIALVVVAGMEYASYVENMNGKDVLASTELWAMKELDGRIKDATDNAAYRINNMKI